MFHVASKFSIMLWC